MKIPPFNVICPNRDHCATCRSLNDGRPWRRSLGNVYDVPDVDFACPEGKPFVDDAPPGTPMPITSRPPEEIPGTFDVERERARLQQGGCCGAPST